MREIITIKLPAVEYGELAIMAARAKKPIDKYVVQAIAPQQQDVSAEQPEPTEEE